MDLREIRQRLAGLLSAEGVEADELLEMMRRGFAKNEPVSCLQHCLSVALISASLAEHLGLEEVGLAYAAGLVHDYEKLGPDFAGLSDEEKIDVLADHLDAMGIGGEGEARRAIRIARSLEEGFTPLPDRRVASIVKIADYLMGTRYPASDPIAVAELLERLARERLRQSLDPRPVLLGGQRPIALHVAERLVEEIEEEGGRPLVATPTGLVYLGGPGPGPAVYRELAARLVQSLGAAGAARPARGGRSRRQADPVGNAERRGDQLCSGRNPGAAVSMRKPPSMEDLERVAEALLSPETPEARKPLILLGFIIFAAKRLSPENPKGVVPELARLLGVRARSFADLARSLGACDHRLPEGYEKAVKAILEKAREAETRLGEEEVVDYIAWRLRELLRVPSGAPGEEAEPPRRGGWVHCSICRAPMPSSLAKKFTFKKYRDVIAEAGVNLRQEVFHPDIQGDPVDTKAVEQVKLLPVCPLCYYEAKYMVSTGIVPGNWNIVVYYGPAVAYDLLEAAKRAVVQKGEAAIHADPLSAKLVAPTTLQQLNKTVLRAAFRYWYLVGGSVALTRNPFILPTPTSKIIYMDERDAVIEMIDGFMTEALERARRTGDYAREATHALRAYAYRLLSLYVDSLEEARARGTVRLRPSLRVPEVSPAVTVLSMYSASRERMRRR